MQFLSPLKIGKPPVVVAPLADMLHQTLSTKSAMFSACARSVPRESESATQMDARLQDANPIGIRAPVRSAAESPATPQPHMS